MIRAGGNRGGEKGIMGMGQWSTGVIRFQFVREVYDGLRRVGY